MGDINYISIEEFRDFGFLQELNRKFLHPMGLAVEVRLADEKSAAQVSDRIRQAVADDVEDPEAVARIVDRVMAVLDDQECLQSRLGGIWDYRDDPEGIVYGDDIIDADKANRVMRHRVDMAMVRYKALGFYVQPTSDDALTEFEKNER